MSTESTASPNPLSRVEQVPPLSSDATRSQLAVLQAVTQHNKHSHEKVKPKISQLFNQDSILYNEMGISQ